MLSVHEAFEDPEVRAHVASLTVNQRVANDWEGLVKAHAELRTLVGDYVYRLDRVAGVESHMARIKMCILYDDLNDEEIEELAEALRQKEVDVDTERVLASDSERAIVARAKELGFREPRKLALLAPWKPI